MNKQFNVVGILKRYLSEFVSLDTYAFALEARRTLGTNGQIKGITTPFVPSGRRRRLYRGIRTSWLCAARHNWTCAFLFLSMLFATISLANAPSELVLSGSDVYEQPMVIVVPTYNNNKYTKGIDVPLCIKNLDSLCYQNYNNYHIVIIDDVSPDGTGEIIENYIEERNLWDRVTLIRNTTRVGALANIYFAVHNYCEDNAVVVTFDGDDWAPHNNVLSYLNKVYSDSNVWLTYGQFVSHPRGQRGFCAPFPAHIIKENKFREYRWLVSHLRTFRAFLFKSIKYEDLMYNGNFYQVTWDLVMMYPMIEMAGERHKFIDEPLYVYNTINPISDSRVHGKEQSTCDKYVRRQPKYQRLDAIPVNSENLEVICDC